MRTGNHTPWALALLATSLGCATADPSARPSQTVRDNPHTAETELALGVKPATGPAAPAANPFDGMNFFVDPHYTRHVMSTINLAPDKADVLEKVARIPTGLWLDRIEALRSVPGWLAGAREQQADQEKPVVPVIVVYDLPNRDCAAKASSGELVAEQNGEARYRSEFIDPLASELSKHGDQRVVIVLEPDSLANMATNMSVPKCAASGELYKRSVAYAISKLSMQNVYLYLDAAHAGWLGWDGNREAIAEIYKEVLDMAGGPERIRGFATNVSNYNALDGEWGWKLESSNPCPNEYCYVEKLDETLAKVGITGKGFLVDTSRNGVADARTSWGNWCNVKGAGLGERPRVAPRPLIDAYFWVKPPGDSDGVADASAERFDAACASVDSAADAPEAGHWFSSYFLDLVANATPPL